MICISSELISSRDLNYFLSTYIPIQNLHINLEVGCPVWNSLIASQNLKRVVLTFKAFHCEEMYLCFNFTGWAINNAESMEQSKITNNNRRLTPLTYRFRRREQKRAYRVNEAIVCVRGFSALWSLVSKCRWSKNRLKISSGIKPVITSVKKKASSTIVVIP